MKYSALLSGLALFLAVPTWAAAQNTAPKSYPRVELGAYGTYMHFAATNPAVNFAGLGGRIDFNVARNLGLEAQMDYDFARNYTSTSSSSNSGGISTNFVTTGLRPLTGLFGPRIQVGTAGPVTAFVTGQVGFIDFSTSNPNAVSGSTFNDAVNSVGGSGTHLAVYPGGGLEFNMGFLSLRADAGDEMYLANGAHNNLRITFGPQFRF